MDSMNSCLLCFNECDIPNTDNANLHKACRKFLHSAFITKFEDKQKCFPICTQCLESATQLVDLSDELKLMQKRVSELVLTFSLEILHRRRKKDEIEDNAGKQVIEVDVYDILSNSIDISTTATKEDNSILPDQDFIESDITTEIKIEEVECENRFWNEEQNFYDPEDYNLGFTANAETSELNIQSSGETSVLKLGELACQGDGSNPVKINDVQKLLRKGKNKKTAPNITDSDSKGRMITEEGPSQEICNEPQDSSIMSKLISYPEDVNYIFNPSTAAAITIKSSDSGPSTISIPHNVSSHIPQTDFTVPKIVKSVQNNSKNDLTKKLFPCNECGQGFSREDSMARHMRRAHDCDMPYKCDVCDNRFKYKIKFIRHLQLHTDSETN